MKSNQHIYMASTAILALILCTLCTSCVKDELHDTPHPCHGAVVVTADWSGRSSEACIPQQHILRIGEQEQEAGGDANMLGQLLPPGQYTLAVYNRPKQMTVTGNTAMVNSTQQGGVSPQPGYLFAAVQDICVQADDTVCVTAHMKQLVRRLNLELIATEGDYSRVLQATATLSGVASAVDIVTGERSVPTQTSELFTQEGNKFTLHFRLAGIVEAHAQRLTVDITFNNGDMQRIESDLTNSMRDFNSGKEPIRLAGNLLLPVEAGGAGATITGWNETDNGNVEAN